MNSSQNIDQKICEVLLEINDRTKSMTENLKKLNSMKGEKHGKSKRAIYDCRRVKAV